MFFSLNRCCQFSILSAYLSNCATWKGLGNVTEFFQRSIPYSLVRFRPYLDTLGQPASTCPPSASGHPHLKSLSPYIVPQRSEARTFHSDPHAFYSSLLLPTSTQYIHSQSPPPYYPPFTAALYHRLTIQITDLLRAF